MPTQVAYVMEVKIEELPKSTRGFASMSPERKREIASKGGKRAHELGLAHKFTSEEAAAAGRKGGTISRRRPKTPADEQ